MPDAARLAMSGCFRTFWFNWKYLGRNCFVNRFLFTNYN